MGGGGGAGVGTEHLIQLFAKGSLVEVGSDEQGFKGAWYVATVIDAPSRSSSSASKKKTPNSNKFHVEYQSLVDDDGFTPLREHVRPNLVRPLPPPPSETDLVPSFQLYDVVDAFYRDGWWTGVISRLLGNSRCVVIFQNPPDEIEFGLQELRVHWEWADDKWIRPEKKRITGLMFSTGKRVEVSFDKEDYRDVWFPATVLEDLGNNYFLVEYHNLGNGDEAVLLKATVDLLHIRPSPPHLKDTNFVLLDKVDGFHNFGWWSGVITKELADRRYIVYFKHTNKDMELNLSDLRPHVDWIDGKWIATSQDVLTPSDYQEHVGHSYIATNNTEMATQLVSSGATKDNSEDRALCPLKLGDNWTQQSTSRNVKPSSYATASLRKKMKQNLESDASHLQPSKKLRDGNAPATPTLTIYQLNTMSLHTLCKENLCGSSNPATGGAGTTCSKQSRDDDQPSAKTKSRSWGKTAVRGKTAPNKQQKVGELYHRVTRVAKRKGRPQKLQVKTPLPSTGGKNHNAGVDIAEEFDEEECRTKEIDIPAIVVGLPCNVMGSPQAENPHQLPSEESLKSISDQKHQLNDPERHKFKEISQLKGGVDSPKRKRGRPPKFLQQSLNASVAYKKQNGDLVAADEIVEKDCIMDEVELPAITVAASKKLPNGSTRRKTVTGSMMKMPPAKKHKLPNEKVMQGLINQFEKPSSKRGRKPSKGVETESPIQGSRDPSKAKRDEGSKADSMMKVRMAVGEVPSNASDDQPLSRWFEGMHSPTPVDGSGVSPNRTIRQCSESSAEQIEIAVQAAAVNGSGDIAPDANQSLPFVKTFPLWETIESMEVFRVLPQKPHFRPLDSCKKSSREGLAIGCMVTFSNVVKKTSEMQFDDPRSSIEDSLETLFDLEGHGFDVKTIRVRLTGLLLIKDRQELLLDQSKEVENRIMDLTHKETKTDVEIREIDKQIRELQEKRALAVSMKEIKDSELASLQSGVNTINEGIKSVQLEFEELAAAPW